MRIAGGNFRLIDRLFSQITRILKINNLHAITKDVEEAARKCLHRANASFMLHFDGIEVQYDLQEPANPI
jgi:uncharacterized protein YigA (DUF484 family)